MKSLNLRMDDEQHAQLEQWARLSRRSMNAEIIHRLFDTSEADSLPPLYQGDRSLYAEPRDAKPDPKPTKAEKKGRR